MGRSGHVASHFFSTGDIMKNAIQQFLRDEEGVAAIEYGLLAGLIAVLIIGGATAVGTNLGTIFSTIGSTLGTASGNVTTNAAKTN
jgi:pilus assembly protein Flp/PilA